MGHIFGLKIARRSFVVQMKKEEGTLAGERDRNFELSILRLHLFLFESRAGDFFHARLKSTIFLIY